MSYGAADALLTQDYDVLISDLAPEDFAAAVKSSEHFSARLFQGFRPTAQAARNPVSLARRLRCPIVTRDQMLDWDPQGIVHKIRFDIDRWSAEILDITIF